MLRFKLKSNMGIKINDHLKKKKSICYSFAHPSESETYQQARKRSLVFY